MTHPVLHFEVAGKDLDKLQAFYGELFGWKTQKAPGDMPYAMVEKEEGGIGGGARRAPRREGRTPGFFRGRAPPGGCSQSRACRRQRGRARPPPSPREGPGSPSP